MKNLSVKTNDFKESIIRGMTRMAVKYNALNLSQGFPEFMPPKEILDRLERVSHDGRFQQYPIGHGAINTREALTKKHKKFTGIDFDHETEVVITCGGTEAMATTILTLCDKGDKIVAFSPLYENYKTQCAMAGVELLDVKLDPNNNYNFDANELEDCLKNNDVKAIILCNPSNPCGKVFTLEEMTIIANLAKKYDLYVITDEVYEHIVFDDNKMVYMASLPDMRERTICCGSLSKTYSITGWRIGYIFAPKEIMNSMKKVHNFLTIASPAPLQEAITVGLNFEQQYYDNLLNLYTTNRNILLDGFDTLGIKYNKPQGTYFMLIDLGEYLQKSGATNELEFAEMLCQKVGVCFVPCESFFTQKTNGIFRIHFAKNKDTLYETLNRLEKLKQVF